MIVYSGSRLKATDTNGDTQNVSVQGAEQDELKVSDYNLENLLVSILKELRKNNMYMTIISDMYIKNSDLGDN